ncbi:tyrosine-type recombinase/integrase [Duganella vulcania]|uniref:Tyrosine-type recombinase/integrase n=1 Tax=Duganella vulcania TaxID=2692166 RepID=A0A845GS78_9BURK|nr:tyrosine-type recombinase/integrase [Duganella vulcania]MYM96871.1 tyrosine-type recombinase/integrase [Duganella vulcania]
MARLETIQFQPMREVVEEGRIQWKNDKLGRPVANLPQIFWSNGEPWSEVNHWALMKVTSSVGGHIKTVTSLMKHLGAYADWLEAEQQDWRHFPERMADRTIVRFRGELIAQRKRGVIRPSTATVRMLAVIQFYRHAQVYGFVGRQSPMWRDEAVVLRYHDSVGFQRTLLRMKSELSIPNRARPGLMLEDGLVALQGRDAQALLKFTANENLIELHLMLSIGMLTGARIGTITSISIRNLEDALSDPSMPGFCRMPVGPGTGISTKFDVSGDLLVPAFLVGTLKSYAYSMERLRRQAHASKEHRGLLFLTSRGNPYQQSSFNRLMTDLRRRATAAGLRFMQTFKFHQTRCTYGTWLMELALRVTSQAAAVAFVRDAMLHKDEATTMRYVRFVQQAPVKALISNEFTVAFSGILNRDWNNYHA